MHGGCMSEYKTHLVVCKNPKALEYLYSDDSCCCLIASKSKRGEPVSRGDAMVARDELIEAGFKWGIDFYIKVVG